MTKRDFRDSTSWNSCSICDGYSAVVESVDVVPRILNPEDPNGPAYFCDRCLRNMLAALEAYEQRQKERAD